MIILVIVNVLSRDQDSGEGIVEVLHPSDDDRRENRLEWTDLNNYQLITLHRVARRKDKEIDSIDRTQLLSVFN